MFSGSLKEFLFTPKCWLISCLNCRLLSQLLSLQTTSQFITMRALGFYFLLLPLLSSAISNIPDRDSLSVFRRAPPGVVPHEPPPSPKSGPDEPSTLGPNNEDPLGGTSGGSSGGTSGGSSGGKGGGIIGADPSDSVLDTGGIYKPPEVVTNEGTSSQSTLNQGVDGTATQTNRDLCGPDKETCIELINTAVDMIKEVVENVGSSTSTTSTTTSTSTSTSTSQSPGSTDGPLLNANMSSWMDLRRYHEQLTPDEFNMLKNSPVCFFANMEVLYQSYANQGNSTNPTATSSSLSSAATTTDASGRLLRRTPQGKPSCDQDSNVLGVNNCASTLSLSSSLSSSSSAATDLYLSYIPSQVRMVYLSTPTSLHVTATSTTSCAGLGANTTAFETTYGLFGYKEGFSPSSTGAAATSTATGGMVTGAAAVAIDQSWFLRGLSASLAALVWFGLCT